MNVVQAFDHKPHIHRRVLDWLKSCRERGIRVVGPGRSRPTPASPSPSRTGTCSTIPQAWCEATTGTRDERLAKLADPARRAALRDKLPITATGPLPRDRHRRPAARQEQEVARLHAGPCRREDGQASGRRHARHGGRGGPQDRVLRRPPNGKIEHLKELVDDPYVLFGVSDGGAHTKFLTAGRYPTETLCKVVREHKMLSPGGRALAAVGPAGRGRGLPRPRRAAEGRAGRHRGLRLRRLARAGRARSCTTCRAANGGASSAPGATSTCW